MLRKIKLSHFEFMPQKKPSDNQCSSVYQYSANHVFLYGHQDITNDFFFFFTNRLTRNVLVFFLLNIVFKYADPIFYPKKNIEDVTESFSEV